MKTFKQFLTEAKILPSQNKSWGFYNELYSIFDGDANKIKTVWKEMFELVSNITNMDSKQIRDLLDSKAGRWLADEFHTDIENGNLTKAFNKKYDEMKFKKTYKAFLAESIHLNEALKIDDYQSLAYNILSNYRFFEKACKFLKIDDSNDDLFNEIYYVIKKPEDCYKIIKGATGINLKHMNDRQASDILYILTFNDEWIERIANIMIKHKIGNVDKNWSMPSFIHLPFENYELSSKELKTIVKELGI